MRKTHAQKADVTSLKEATAAKKKEEYKTLVMRAYDDFEHADERDFLDKRAEVERQGRERL